MPHPLSNPFAKPIRRNPDDAELVALTLGPEAAARMRKLVGTPEKNEMEAELPITDIEMSAEEKERAQSLDYWSKAQYVAWAKMIGKDADWVEETFVFEEDGRTRVEGDLNLSGQNLEKLPHGIREIGRNLYLNNNQLTSRVGLPEKIGGSLDLSNNRFTSLEGLPKEIRRDLWLRDIPATTIPENIKIEGIIIIRKEQKALTTDAEMKGYRVFNF